MGFGNYMYLLKEDVKLEIEQKKGRKGLYIGSLGAYVIEGGGVKKISDHFFIFVREPTKKIGDNVQS